MRTHPYEDSLAVKVNVSDSKLVRKRHCVRGFNCYMVLQVWLVGLQKNER